MEPGKIRLNQPKKSQPKLRLGKKSELRDHPRPEQFALPEDQDAMDTNLFDILEGYTEDYDDDSLLDSFTERPGFDAGYSFETGNRYGNNCIRLFNGSCFDSNNASSDDDDEDTLVPWSHNYWTLVLLIFPIFTVFGNVLVVLSVYREKTLQTVTNYFIVSLAIADIMVAILVMPLAVYVEVNNRSDVIVKHLCLLR